MQQHTSNQEDFVDKELLDCLKKNYYFVLEEKFRLYQRASFLFVVLVPTFAVLFQLLITYDNPQILERVFLIFLTISLVISILFLFRSLWFKNYTYISPRKIIRCYNNKNEKKFIKILVSGYAFASIKNRKIIKKRNKDLWKATRFGAISVFILIFFSIYIFIKDWYWYYHLNNFYQYFISFFYL